MSDFIVPHKGFSSFNDFFTRKLKKGVRSIEEKNNNSIITSPIDGSIDDFVIDLVGLGTKMVVKGMSLNVSNLLGYSKYATKFIGGKAITCDLDVYNYHRFHSPVDGKIIEANYVNGLYFGLATFESFFE